MPTFTYTARDTKGELKSATMNVQVLLAASGFPALLKCCRWLPEPPGEIAR